MLNNVPPKKENNIVPEIKQTLTDLAIEVERRGIAFYDTIARSTDNADARHIFEHLAEMEREHVAILQKMFTEPYQLPTPSDYFSDLVKASVFSGSDIVSPTALDADTDTKAVEIGITAEKDSILLYYEIRDILPESVRWQVDRIIGEEKLHLGELVDLKKSLEGE